MNRGNKVITEHFWKSVSWLAGSLDDDSAFTSSCRDFQIMATKIDREKECPFLLRIFTRTDGHHANHEFSPRSLPTQDELRLYTWKDATLEELAQLIQEVTPEAQLPDSRLSFRLVYLDNQRGIYLSKPLGRVHNGRPTEDQNKTLDELRFFIGDYLDVAIYTGPPLRRNDWPPREGPRGGRGPRFSRDIDSRLGRDGRGPPYGGRRERY